MLRLLMLLGWLLLAAPSWAVPIDWIDSTVNQQAQTVSFTIRFAAKPDFYTVDAFNRQADSFQLFSFDTPMKDESGLAGGCILCTSITRGEEIHYGDGIPVRAVFDTTGIFDPRSGGWGSILEIDPFVQHGETISFTESLQAIGHTGSSPFGYGFLTTEFGASSPIAYPFWGRCASDSRCAVPIPDMVWPTVAGMIGLACLVAWRRKRKA